MLSKMKNRRLTAQKLLSIEDKSEMKTWHLGIKIWASDKPVGICLGTMGPWSPAALWEQVSGSSWHLLPLLLSSPSGPRPLSRPSHTHRAVLLMVGTLYSHLSCLSAQQSHHQLQNFILYWGQTVHDLQRLSLLSNLCSSSLSPTSVNSSSSLPGQI